MLVVVVFGLVCLLLVILVCDCLQLLVFVSFFR